MSRASLVELTNLCVICDGSRVLVQDKIGCGVVFPGGHVEPGESMLASVIREMREETGLLIEASRALRYQDWMREDGTRFIVALYRADRFSGELNSSEEGRMFWIEREEFAKTNTIWGMKDVLRVCDEAEYSKCLFGRKRGGCCSAEGRYAKREKERGAALVWKVDVQARQHRF